MKYPQTYSDLAIGQSFTVHGCDALFTKGPEIASNTQKGIFPKTGLMVHLEVKPDMKVQWVPNTGERHPVISTKVWAKSGGWENIPIVQHKFRKLLPDEVIPYGAFHSLDNGVTLKPLFDPTTTIGSIPSAFSENRSFWVLA